MVLQEGMKPLPAFGWRKLEEVVPTFNHKDVIPEPKRVEESDLYAAQLPISSVRDAVVCLQPVGSGTGLEPTIDELREMVAELIAVYSDPSVQREIAQVQKKFMEESKGTAPAPTQEVLLNRLREVLLPRQAKIAEAYGLPGTSEGLQRLQNAVQRRILEGDVELRCLADEALMLVGLPPLNNIVQELPAEEFLSVVLNAGGETSWVEVEEFFTGLGPVAAETLEQVRELINRRMPLSHLNFGLLRTWSAWEKLGLPEAAMSRSFEPPPVARLRKPTVRQVFEYVVRNQPVIIEGAMTEEGFPPFRDFKDFDYLKELCGDRYVKVKCDACWDKKGNQIFVNDPAVELPMADFLDRIEECEATGDGSPFYMGKVPLKTDVPEMWEELLAAPASPMKKYGGCFGGNPKGCHTYFGVNGNTTAVHADPSENLLAVVMGTKVFEIYPPWDADCLYPTLKKCLNSSVPPFIKPDEMPPEVEDAFPLYKHTQPQRVELKEGDLLYLPIFWWHAVQGGSGRNMILVWWCDIHPRKIEITSENEKSRGILENVRKLHEAGYDTAPSPPPRVPRLRTQEGPGRRI